MTAQSHKIKREEKIKIERYYNGVGLGLGWGKKRITIILPFFAIIISNKNV